MTSQSSDTCNTINSIYSTLSLPEAWTDKTSLQTINDNGIKLCKISDSPPFTLTVTHTLTVLPDLSWKLFVHGKEVKECASLQTIPCHLSLASLQALLALIDRLNVCVGHPDDKMIDLINCLHKGLLAASYLDESGPVLHDGVLHAKTVRTFACQLLVYGNRCPVCTKHRATLRSMLSRQKKSSNTTASPTSSHTNNRHMHTPQLKQKMKRLREKLSASVRAAKRLRAQIDKLNENAVPVDEDLSNDLITIMKESTEIVRHDCPEDTFRRIFWEQQMAALSKKDKRQIRWHPLMIRYLKSSYVDRIF